MNEAIEEDSDGESLEDLPYFHGDINRDEAESRLKEEPLGTFLVRLVLFRPFVQALLEVTCLSTDPSVY